MTFVADCMLGRLAKWLKILGFDVLFFSKAEDKDLVELARRESRVLLTRDSGLIEKNARRKNRLFIRSDDWEDQVAQAVAQEHQPATGSGGELDQRGPSVDPRQVRPNPLRSDSQ